MADESEADDKLPRGFGMSIRSTAKRTPMLSASNRFMPDLLRVRAMSRVPPRRRGDADIKGERGADFEGLGNPGRRSRPTAPSRQGFYEQRGDAAEGDREQADSDDGHRPDAEEAAGLSRAGGNARSVKAAQRRARRRTAAGGVVPEQHDHREHEHDREENPGGRLKDEGVHWAGSRGLAVLGGSDERVDADGGDADDKTLAEGIQCSEVQRG